MVDRAVADTGPLVAILRRAGGAALRPGRPDVFRDRRGRLAGDR